jgi:hypothetical protein
VLRSATFGDGLFKVGKCLDIEQWRHVAEEIRLQPHGFIDAERLKSGLVENRDRSHGSTSWSDAEPSANCFAARRLVALAARDFAGS